MSECKYFGLGKTCKRNMNCRDTYCKQHPDYYRVKATEDANYMQVAIGKRVRAYKDSRKYVDGNTCTHGKLVKVFVRGNSVAYKVKDDHGNVITCHYIEETLFQG